MNEEYLPHIQNLAFGGLMRTVTPDDVADDLIKNGYARKAVGGLVATDAAHQLLITKGFKPPSWK